MTRAQPLVMDSDYDAFESSLRELVGLVVRSQESTSALKEAVSLLRRMLRDFERLKDERLKMQMVFANRVAQNITPPPES